jgi:ArsR family transcriptional regulator, virulence genes transcriptional regulator
MGKRKESSGILEKVNIKEIVVPDEAGIVAASGILSALSNPQRLQILCHLVRHGELSVGSLQDRMELSQSALSQHLARLRLIGLLETRKEKQAVFYRVARDDVSRILELLHDLYCDVD